MVAEAPLTRAAMAIFPRAITLSIRARTVFIQ